MHFIPNAVLGASSQIVASLYCGDPKTADPHACIHRRAFPATIVHSPDIGLKAYSQVSELKKFPSLKLCYLQGWEFPADTLFPLFLTSAKVIFESCEFVEKKIKALEGGGGGGG